MSHLKVIEMGKNIFYEHFEDFWYFSYCDIFHLLNMFSECSSEYLFTDWGWKLHGEDETRSRKEDVQTFVQAFVLTPVYVLKSEFDTET